MKRHLFLSLTALSLIGQTHADVRVPNTKVSYNEKGIYIDERYDTLGKTYLAIVCSRGSPQIAIYSKIPLASNDSLGLVNVAWAVDSEYFGYGLGLVRKDRQAGHLGVWEADGADIYNILSVLKSAENSVSTTIERAGLSPVTFTFPVKGLDKAFRDFSCLQI